MSKNKVKTTGELLQEALVPVEEQPYQIPENWLWVRLKYINNGLRKGIEPSKFHDEVFELYSVPSFVNNNPEILSGNEISSNKQLVAENDILICKINPRINRVWIVNQKNKYKQIASTEWIVVSNNRIFPRYLMHLFRSPYFRSLLTSNVSGVGGSLTRARPNDVGKYPVAIPPFNEQKRIADKVERLLNKINQAKQLIEEAKETFELRRAAVLDKAFRGELTANWRMENDVDFDWEIKKLGNLVEYGPQNGLYKSKDAYGDGTLIVRIDSFYNGEIKEWGTLKRLRLEDNEINIYGLENDDVIINRVNSIEYLGKSALVRNLIEPAVFESNVMRIKLTDKIIPEFLILYLNSFKGLEELRKNAKHAVNQASINQQDVKNVTVPLPTKKEQIEIIRMLNMILNKEKGAAEGIDLMEKVNRLENSILSRAFRGELGTNESTDESAASLLINCIQE